MNGPMFRFFEAGEMLTKLDGTDEFVALDLETTGLYPSFDRITEIGAVRFNLKGSCSVYETLVDPERPIPPDATRVSGITDEMVRGKPKIEETVGELLEFAGNAPFIAHNARFDGGFLRAVLLRAGRALPPNPMFDTCLMARKLWPEWRGYSLAKVLNSLGLFRENLHRAMGDALACRDVFLSCLSKINEELFISECAKRIAIILTEDDVDETI